jgi:hypothetical protein
MFGTDNINFVRVIRGISKNIKIRTYKTIILPVVLYWCETWSLTLKGGIYTEGVREQGAEENILIEER